LQSGYRKIKVGTFTIKEKEGLLKLLRHDRFNKNEVLKAVKIHFNREDLKLHGNHKEGFYIAL